MKKRMLKTVKRIYQYVADQPVLATICFGIHRIYKRIGQPEYRPAYGSAIPSWTQKKPGPPKYLRQVKIAMICDDMTWENWRRECDVMALTPNNWKKTLCKERPDVFFCESAWSGLKEHGNCWQGCIYRNHRVLFDNRKELLRILAFCKRYGIPTVFWNKEDPLFFDSIRYDFKDTALKFDWIFTTAAECVPLYRKAGHRQTDVMMFSFSPYLFSPLNSLPKESRAVFAGSWISEDKRRCRDMELLFDWMQEQGILLTIYDRQTSNAKEGREYPKKYHSYIRECVPFEQVGEKVKHAKYAININTVTDSDTMFARRVFELAASNVLIFSNESKGMKKIFHDGICYLGEPFKEEKLEEKVRRNMNLVFAGHTNSIRFTEMLVKMGVLRKQEKIKIGVLDTDDRLAGKNVEGKWFAAVFLRDLKEAEGQSFDYGIWLSEGCIQTLDSVLSHFCYLPERCGIKITGTASYTLVRDSDHKDVIYPWEIFAEVQLKSAAEQVTEKYILGECGI